MLIASVTERMLSLLIGPDSDGTFVRVPIKAMSASSMDNAFHHTAMLIAGGFARAKIRDSAAVEHFFENCSGCFGNSGLGGRLFLASLGDGSSEKLQREIAEWHKQINSAFGVDAVSELDTALATVAGLTLLTSLINVTAAAEIPLPTAPVLAVREQPGPAAEDVPVHRWNSTTEAGSSRNSACSCGSGKKFKSCCGKMS
jgi:hypothetical protein